MKAGVNKWWCKEESKLHSGCSYFVIALPVIFLVFYFVVNLGIHAMIEKMTDNTSGKRESTVLSHQHWDILSNTAYSHAYVEDIKAGKRIEFGDSELSLEFRNVLKALGGKCIYSVSMMETNAHYVVSWHAGMDPAFVPVVFWDGKACFCFRGIWYCGGDSALFLKAISRENPDLSPK